MKARSLFIVLTSLSAACSGAISPSLPAVPASEVRSGSSRRGQGDDAPNPNDPVADAIRANDDGPATVLPSIIGGRSRGSSTLAVAAANVSIDGAMVRAPSEGMVRVALVVGQQSARIGSAGDFEIYDHTGRVVAHAHGGDSYTVAMRDGSLEAVPLAGGVTARDASSLTARSSSSSSALIEVNGKRYRGEVAVLPANGGLSVVNRTDVDSYLRGVVPLEIGADRTPFELAAVEAQAIAARSYAFTKVDGSRSYDLVSTVSDQVYGGADAERPLSDEAVGSTRGMVLTYAGKIINAPYSSSSGGVTASASEVWRSGDEPYLVSVIDKIPGTDHYYGEDSPRFHWTRTLDRATLLAAATKYLPQYAGAPHSGLGALHGIATTGRTPSGRVASLVFQTDAGSFTVRGNDVRFVLRSATGELLPSTLFDLDVAMGDDGRVDHLTIRGAGNGHGVGMDQWGAIARARAGQDASTILHAYYPGAGIGKVI